MALKRLASWAEQIFTPDKAVQKQFALFQGLLQEDKKCLKLITRLEEIYHQPIVTDWRRITLLSQALASSTKSLVQCLINMRPEAYAALSDNHARIAARLQELLPSSDSSATPPFTLPLETAANHPDLLGGKALALARIRHETDIPIPPGFVVTTNAYHAFLLENDLESLISRHLQGLDLRRQDRLQKTANSIKQAVMRSVVPKAVSESIAATMRHITDPDQSPTWAVRSSAGAEDGELSFAGQYASVLDVHEADMNEAYKTVLASKFDVRALTYRLHYGLDDRNTPMAVLVLPMISPRVSGVLYSRDPLDMCRGECLVISAIQGLGAGLVNGTEVPDIFLVSRQNPEHFLAKQPAPKQPAARQAGTTQQTFGQETSGHKSNTSPLPLKAETNTLCLDDASAAILAKWGLELEALTGSPQDVEWTQDQEGNLLVLQSRPIHLPGLGQAEPASDESQGTPKPQEHIAKLLEVGTPASAGIAAGSVYRISGDADLGAVPAESIVLTPTTPPSLVSLVHKVRAVLAEQGSKASHFASVAREFGLPLVVGLGDLTGILTQGQTVTVDAYRGVVYEGEVKDLLAWQEKQKNKAPIPFQKSMEPLMELVSPLHLTDPTSPDFTPDNCRTFHDLVRFVHEKGTLEMFSLVNAKGRGLRKAKSLDSNIPIVMYVLDLGEGLSEAAQDLKTVLPEHFQSAPMQAAWSGLTDKDIQWSEGLLHMDWERFDQLSGGIFSLKSSLLASYALVAKNYVHVLLRFGYHFAVLDALSGDRPEENHIQFRFKGGGGAPAKRGWRLALIGKVLIHFGFQVTVQEDMLEAKCMRLDFQATQLRLQILGYLLGRTPLLDMALESEEHALRMAEELVRKWQPNNGDQ